MNEKQADKIVAALESIAQSLQLLAHPPITTFRFDTGVTIDWARGERDIRRQVFGETES